MLSDSIDLIQKERDLIWDVALGRPGRGRL